MKEFSNTYTFPFSWEVVASGFWIKYPNPFSKHVLSEDVISRHINAERVLVTKRLLVKERNVPIPKWLDRLMHVPKNVYIIEETYCDPRTKTLTSYTRNFTFTSAMTCIEKCVYKQDPTDPTKTVCKKEAQIISNLRVAGTTIEKFALQSFKRNADRAAKGLLFILEKFQVNNINRYNI